MISKFYKLKLDDIDESFHEVQTVVDLNRLHAMALKELSEMSTAMNKMFEDLRKDFDNLI